MLFLLDTQNEEYLFDNIEHERFSETLCEIIEENGV
jgi:hypothetical protein